MRLSLLFLGTLAGLWFAFTPGSSPAATATPRPTPTIKACHICDEEIIPPATPTPAEAAATEKGEAVVHAVLFWMATCPHCHYVLDEVLPPLEQKYGDRLQIRLIEVNSEEAWNQLVQVGAAMGFSPDQLGVPFLVIGDKALIGSAQIPDELPGLIEQYLATGGVDYPNLPGLSQSPPTATPMPTLTPAIDPVAVASCSPATPCAEEEPPEKSATPAAMMARLTTDVPEESPTVAPSMVSPRPNGFGLAIGIMAGMVVALAYVGVITVRGFDNTAAYPAAAWFDAVIPVLAIIGLGVAVYLAYVETQAVAAVCGPVGDCNAVQASPYAKLFGILPVGVLGVLGYAAILAAWVWGRFGSGRLAGYVSLAIFGMALFGTLFSLYLTYLEPFVIGAVCIWCLTSAVIITLLMLFSFKPALRVMRPPH
ncbi:MAG: vitamin K epoxide reductase [Chloroflexi bacterium]|nr:MAG: vitamin K epoxide reductase [Chloroflexota bacterium]